MPDWDSVFSYQTTKIVVVKVGVVNERRLNSSIIPAQHAKMCAVLLRAHLLTPHCSLPAAAQDRWLGVLRLVMMLAIFVYIVINVLVIERQYLGR